MSSLGRGSGADFVMQDLPRFKASTKEVLPLPCTTSHSDDRAQPGEAELGVIDRYASLISSLDSSLEAREDDEFLAWLDSSRASPASAASTDSAPSEGVDGSGDGSAAASDGRHRVEQFISDAAARLDTLVAHKQDMLFRDRDLRIGKDGDNGATAAAAEAGTGTETGAQAGEAATAATALPEDELYQVCERANERAGTCTVWSTSFSFERRCISVIYRLSTSAYPEEVASTSIN